MLLCRLHGSCNHIAGLLFRVEYAVRTGLVDVSCTSQACMWNLPSAKGSLTQPHVAAELEWKTAHYAKQSKRKIMAQWLVWFYCTVKNFFLHLDNFCNCCHLSCSQRCVILNTLFKADCWC